MKRVIIESPYAGDIAANVAYAQDALRDSLSRGEAPLASHLLYPQILDDADPPQRRSGINAGLAWHGVADEIIFYTDRGWSPGMLAAHDYAVLCGKLISFRGLLADPVPPPRIYFDAPSKHEPISSRQSPPAGTTGLQRP